MTVLEHLGIDVGFFVNVSLAQGAISGDDLYEGGKLSVRLDNNSLASGMEVGWRRCHSSRHISSMTKQFAIFFISL